RLWNLTVSEVRIDGDRTVVVQSETFQNLTMEPDTPNNALEVVNQGSRLVQLDRDGMAAIPAPFVATFRPARNGTMSGALPATVPPVASIDTLEVTLRVGSPGIDIGPVPLTLDFGSPAAVPASHTAWAQVLERALRAAASDAAFTGDADF